MQPDSTELPQNATVGPDNPEHSLSTQHGLFGDPSGLSTPPLLLSGERNGSIDGSSTEWSLSSSSALASPGSSRLAGLSPTASPHVHDPDLDAASLSLSLTPVAALVRHLENTGNVVRHGKISTMQEFPEGQPLGLRHRCSSLTPCRASSPDHVAPSSAGLTYCKIDL